MSKLKLQIKNRFTGSIIFEWESENNTLRETIVQAIKSDANLSRANLSGANLSGADLSDANLSRADLSRANLSGANLSGADLSGANLSRADLSRADLSRANLSGANLSRADLSDANLSRANLSGANLSRADLSDADLSRADLSRADLSRIKYDFFGRMLAQKNEVQYLKESITDGRIDGSQYKGQCCCFVGTLAKQAHCDHRGLSNLKPDAGCATERWFLGIKKGDNPENSQISKITLEWVEEFQKLIKS